MSSDVTLGSTVRSEWIKFRTVRSTIMGVAITFVLTIGLGALITLAVRAHWHSMDPTRQLIFDPVSASLSGILFAQFAVGVIGTLFITSEYSSGSIRTTLAAIPNRLELVWGKLIVLVASIFVVAEIACFITFLMGQAIFSGVVPTASLGNSAVLRTVILAGVYLTLLSVLGFSLGLILRQSAACISVFTSLLLILPIIVFLLPQSWQNTMSKYEPSELGHAMTSVTTPGNDFGTWTALLILTIYVVAVWGVGTTMLIRRDA
jgi:ABC-type transport system involved in multi-copper enzyme maturation permease subunit